MSGEIPGRILRRVLMRISGAFLRIPCKNKSSGIPEKAFEDTHKKKCFEKQMKLCILK